MCRKSEETFDFNKKKVDIAKAKKGREGNEKGQAQSNELKSLKQIGVQPSKRALYFLTTFHTEPR